MKFTASICVFFLFCSMVACASPYFNDGLAKDIGVTYGYYLSQSFSLEGLNARFPELTDEISSAEKEFMTRYGPSISNLDSYMTKNGGEKWLEVKNVLLMQARSVNDLSTVTYEQAKEFVNIVEKRAGGKMESPMLEILLVFTPAYENSPVSEFREGNKYKYRSDGSGKSKGVVFSIEIPQSWSHKDGERPNVVQMFESANGHGMEKMPISIMQLPADFSGEIASIFESKSVGEAFAETIIPRGAKMIASGPLTVEDRDGFWVKCSEEGSRARYDVRMESLTYYIPVADKLIQISGGVTVQVNDEIINPDGLALYEELFDQIVNTLVVENLYAR